MSIAGRNTLPLQWWAIRVFVIIVTLTSSLWEGVPSFIFGDVREQDPSDSPPSGLMAGVARVDITPPVGIATENWGAQTFIESKGIHYPLVANVLVLSDGVLNVCLVEYDAINAPRAQEMRQKISQRTGIPFDNILVTVSHTHAGPALRSQEPRHVEVYTRWEDGMLDKIAGAAWTAQQQLQPVHIGGGKGSSAINVNRRQRATEDLPEAVGMNFDAFVDHEVIVARVDDAVGNPVAVLVNFPCHGTVLAWENKMVSPDYIGFVRKAVEDNLPGALCFFLQGAAGNQSAIEKFTGDLRVPERLGKILGLEAATVALEIETIDRRLIFEGYTV